MEVKDGNKTTEFYVTLLTNVIALLVILGVITAEQAEVLSDNLSTVVENLPALVIVATALVNSAYVLSRGIVKTANKKQIIG